MRRAEVSCWILYYLWLNVTRPGVLEMHRHRHHVHSAHNDGTREPAALLLLPAIEYLNNAVRIAFAFRDKCSSRFCTQRSPESTLAFSSPFAINVLQTNPPPRALYIFSNRTSSCTRRAALSSPTRRWCCRASRKPRMANTSAAPQTPRERWAATRCTWTSNVSKIMCDMCILCWRDGRSRFQRENVQTI